MRRRFASAVSLGPALRGGHLLWPAEKTCFNRHAVGHRRCLVLLALFLCSAVVGAQAPLPPALVGTPNPQTVLARVSHEDVTARMLSFDRNSDGKVEKDELAERMHSLVTRGDVNGDGALDRTEIRALATAPPPQQGGRGGFPFSGGGYGFADEIETSSRSHIEGSLDDLRLASPAKEQAQAVVATFVDTFEKAASDDLLKELEPLLAPSQLIDFKWALGSRNRARVATVLLPEAGGRKVVVRGTGLDQLIRGYRLAPPQAQQALAATERYKARLRLSDADRAELVDQLQGILSLDDRESLRAALARRPVVATGSMKFAFAELQDMMLRLNRDQGVTSGPVNALFRGTPVVPTSVRPPDER